MLTILKYQPVFCTMEFFVHQVMRARRTDQADQPVLVMIPPQRLTVASGLECTGFLLVG
jgi:hypothetical protein